MPPPDANSVSDDDALSHERVSTQPAPLADGDGSGDNLPVHSLGIEYVVMVENAHVRAQHGVGTQLHMLGRHQAAIGVEIAALTHYHAGSSGNLQATVIVDVRATPELHHAALSNDEARAAPKIHWLPTVR